MERTSMNVAGRAVLAHVSKFAVASVVEDVSKSTPGVGAAYQIVAGAAQRTK